MARVARVTKSVTRKKSVCNGRVHFFVTPGWKNKIKIVFLKARQINLFFLLSILWLPFTILWLPFTILNGADPHPVVIVNHSRNSYSDNINNDNDDNETDHDDNDDNETDHDDNDDNDNNTSNSG